MIDTDHVQVGKVVSIAFQLFVDDAMVYEVSEETPLEYLHGRSNIVPGLEVALSNLQVGDERVVTLTPEEGYGEYNENLVLQISRKDFRLDEPDTVLQVGQTLKFVDDEDNVIDVVIRKFDSEVVTVDLNPPLAGKALTYHVKVVSIRNATVMEQLAGAPQSLQDEMTFFVSDDD